MLKVTIKDLLECGVHFGHQTRRWNPKMGRFIFGERNGIYIIDLEKTIICLEEACVFLKELAQSGKEVLFVATKKQAQSIVQECAQKAEMPYTVNRWLGGMLTNYETVKKSIDKMKEITSMEESGQFTHLTKKEIGCLLKERDKMKLNLEGIANMKGVPGAIFVVDPHKEHIAVKEARKLRIPVIALIDTNCDPDDVDFPIPGNDDALRSIAVVCNAVADAVSAGVREKEKVKAAEEKKEKAAKKTDEKEQDAVLAEPIVKETLNES